MSYRNTGGRNASSKPKFRRRRKSRDFNKKKPYENTKALPTFSLEGDPLYEQEVLRYENPVPSRQYIASVLSEIQEEIILDDLFYIFKIKDIARQFGLSTRIRTMCREQQLFEDAEGVLHVPENLKSMQGKLNLTIRRRPTCTLMDGSEVSAQFATPQWVLPGDLVELNCAVDADGNSCYGWITGISKKSEDYYMGVVVTVQPRVTVKAISTLFGCTIILDLGTGEEVKLYDQVEFQLKDRNTDKREVHAVLKEYHGSFSNPDWAIDALLQRHNIETQFPESIIQEVKAIEDAWEKNCAKADLVDEDKRVDLTHLPFVTIDGDDAKDFDDALYCEQQNGGFGLYVAIADVGYFVEKDSNLDMEALKRSTSIYLPNRVIPMLPSALSDNLCSLRPNQKRYTMVCQMDLTESGSLKGYRFYEAQICSRHRLTYEEVNNNADLLHSGVEVWDAETNASMKALHALYEELASERERAWGD